MYIKKSENRIQNAVLFQIYFVECDPLSITKSPYQQGCPQGDVSLKNR
jgi:hypothetical protein